MKNFFKLRFLLISLSMCIYYSGVRAQSAEAQQLLLNVEKLSHLKQILSDMKQGYEILTQGYQAVQNIAEGNFSLHRNFLDGLLQVSPEVRHYYRVAEVLSLQKQILSDLSHTSSIFRSSDLFSPQEITYLERVRQSLLKANGQSLEELSLVLTSNALRMGVAERLQTIDRLYHEMESRLSFTRRFRNEALLLVRQRQRESSQIKALQNLYSSPHK